MNKRILCMGDSLTRQGLWHERAMLFLALKHPGKAVRFDGGGGSGDTAARGWVRIDRELSRSSADRVFLMFGINDVGHSLFQEEKPSAEVVKSQQDRRKECLDSMGKLADRITSDGRQITIVLPPPYDSYNEYGTFNSVFCNEQGLTPLVEGYCRIAEKYHADVLDFFHPMQERMKQGMRFFTPDRVHPAVTGHLLMMALLLEHLGEAKIRRETVIRAEGKETLDFRYAPDELDYPYEYEMAFLEKVYPFAEKLNRRKLTVTGLKPGLYDLKADGKIFGRATAEQLEQGIPMDRYPTPAEEQSLKARLLIEQWHNAACRFRHIRFWEEMCLREGGTLEQTSVLHCVDSFMQRLRESHAPNLSLFEEWSGEYRNWFGREPELHAELDRLFSELNALRPPSWNMTVTPK